MNKRKFNSLHKAMQYKSGLGTKQLGVSGMKVKAVDSEEGTFTAYGNVFDVVDHAKDMTKRGCFAKSIKSHKDAGTMPKLLAQHEGRMMPIGIITDIKEDEHGLFFEGKFCLETQAGKEYHALVKMGAIDQFSIGYITIEEKYDGISGINYLLEVDVKEISIVTFACNESSRIQSVKSALEHGEDLTPRMIQDTLRDVYHLSKRQAEAAVNAIKSVNADEEVNEGDNKIMLKNITDVEKFKIVKGESTTTDHRSPQGMKTKDLGGLSFNDVCCGIRKALIKYIGHPDFWLDDIFDGKAYAHYWDYVVDDCKSLQVKYSIIEGAVEVDTITKGNVVYDPTFVSDEGDIEGEEDKSNIDDIETKAVPQKSVVEEEPQEPEVEEKEDDLADLLEKADFSDWFTK